MQSFTFNILKQTAKDTPDFETFKENLVDKLIEREPESHPDVINPYHYIKYPMQEINISDITDSDNLIGRADMQMRNIKRGVPGGHGVAIGRQIESPIAVRMTDAGTYDIEDGMHRPIQAVMNGDKTILAFVVGGNKGITLKELYDQARAEIK
jgi:hypothetical protein